MDEKTKYFFETTAYGVCFLIGVFFSFFFLFNWSLILFTLSLIFTIISIDNFFCGSHAKKCGFPVETHYVLPWNLKTSKISPKFRKNVV